MKELNDLFRDFFDFDRKEIRAFYLLSWLLIFFVGLFGAKEFWLKSSAIVLDTQAQKSLDSLKLHFATLEAEKKATYQNAKKNHFSANKTKITAQRYNFDPNTISKAQWESMGLPHHIANRIENFLSKKGKFSIKDDVKKIYGFPEELFEEIKPYILLPDTFERKKFEKKTFENDKIFAEKNAYTKTPAKETVKILIDINEADSADFCTIKGIGAAFSSRIVKYREKLGGFISVEQLKEVYGLNAEMFEKIAPQIKLTSLANIRKININTADKKQLSAHPYIGYKKADVILNYRKQHKSYKNIDDLRNTSLISEEELAKMKPYLTI